MIKLEFVVWEFVRLMVELEGAKGDRSINDAYAAWQELWQAEGRRQRSLVKTGRKRSPETIAKHKEKMAVIQRGIESTRVISEAAQASAVALLEASCLEHH